MKKSIFLAKLKDQGKLDLVEPSENICSSYIEKAENCLKSARLLFENNLYENSVSMSYYTMYNSLTAMLFKIGIKCENHNGSILLLKILLRRADLYKIIEFAKKERIDKQYYIKSKDNFILTKESSKDMIIKAEEFLVKLKLVIKTTGLNDIETTRNKFNELI